MNESLEFHYKEMVRLASIFDSHSKDAFNDFKLLGAVGALLSWGPLSLSFEQIQPKAMLLGFLAILAVTGLVGIFALMRQSVVNFQLKELIFFETQIRQCLNGPELATFRVAEHWAAWSKTRQRRLGQHFYFLFYFVILAVPCVALFPNRFYMGIYVAAAMVVFAFHFRALSIVYPKGDRA